MFRNPSVGDKLASRAGQKGICSQKWPCEDIPWTSSGLMPDIIFNPHGFPSRMTIAMMIECMAGKSAAMHGQVSVFFILSPLRSVRVIFVSLRCVVYTSTILHTQCTVNSAIPVHRVHC